MADWLRGWTLYHLRTVVYTAVTCVAIFAVWVTGHRDTARVDHLQESNCLQVVELTSAVNDLHGSLKHFLMAARDARLRSPHTKANTQTAHSYEEILRNIHLVRLPKCAR